MARESSGNLVSTSPCDLHLQVHGRIFRLNRELVVSKSAKLAILLKQSQHEEKSSLSLPDIPGDLKTFELIARFFYGSELNLSANNVVPLACLAYYLEMTEAHSPNNLLRTTLAFFEQRVLPSWNESVKSFRSTEHVLKEASFVGLINAILESITKKALADPHLLGGPIQHPIQDDINGNNNNNNGQRRISRRHFVQECQSEDLNTLPLCLYELIMLSMIQHGVRSEYIAGSLFQYAKKWAFTGSGEADVVMYMKMVPQREVIEVVQRLLPDKRSLIPCKLLFEMLRAAFTLQASSDCINGFELRIGKQLDEATVGDLLIPCQSYAREMQYDMECVKRILKNFYRNYTSKDDPSRLITVAVLMDEFLVEVAEDIDMQKDTFILLAEMSVAASHGTQRNSDGIYRAVDIYLEKHGYLTEAEKEEVCRMLDIHKMSAVAREHAAKNQRLPLRVMVQVLFVEQLQLRDVISNEMQDLEERWGSDEEKVVVVGNGEEEEVRIEMEEMDGRVMELEKQCYRMRREIEVGRRPALKKDKENLWKQWKTKLGCSCSIHDYDCHVKKKKSMHPRDDDSSL
ncbi:BTB/POZ domain-containing protein At5g17580-like [Macadamia integrifolia]|uniref:BTB/POZ domain-containing protein At5g17580-like n=1 Tax=Macadamia integrifolia TaxID=60698 RepID=UPI001C4FDACC|nr:BTB/POZ domain-containing protein At5g17580-like [Macadamia integrifolia]XP_042492706.1 BTB/POZ domain-containing protein At5g17580-like [Macadamia integrifolia]